MVDMEENVQQQKPDASPEETRNTQGVFAWVIAVAIVIGGGVGGFALAQLIAQAGPKNVQAKPSAPEPDFFASTQTTATPWQYDLDPVIGNLDEPGVTRFLRIAVTLVMSPEIDAVKGRAYLEGTETMDGKEPLLTDFLSSYISGLTLERVRGQNSCNRIKREIQDGFNDILFPDTKPYIQNVLFREFAVQ